MAKKRTKIEKTVARRSVKKVSVSRTKKAAARRRSVRKRVAKKPVVKKARLVRRKVVTKKRAKGVKVVKPKGKTIKATAKLKKKAAEAPKVALRRSRSASKKPVVKLKVIGIGGGGGNALTRMSRDPIRGVEFIAVNTDLQDLESCDARRKVHIGKTITRGMGAGMNPELGQQSAEEDREEIEAVLQDTDMVFLTAGMGGGTGTGATPVIADIARDMGVLTVAVVTKPFSFEGSARMRIADEGLSRLRDRVDTLLVIPNDRIFNIIDANTPVLKAFDKIDEILKQSVRGVADMITASGLVNVDFADVMTVMKDAGMAVVGVGVAKGKDRAAKAVEAAVNSPLLDGAIDGARGVLFSVAGSRDMKMSEINEAAQMITENVDPAAKIIFGAFYDRRLRKGDLKIILIATGFNGSRQLARDSEHYGLFGGGSDELLDPEFEEPEQTEGESKGEEKLGVKKEKKVKDGETSASEAKEDEDLWEIPAFLRRRKRR